MRMARRRRRGREAGGQGDRGQQSSSGILGGMRIIVHHPSPGPYPAPAPSTPKAFPRWAGRVVPALQCLGPKVKGFGEDEGPPAHPMNTRRVAEGGEVGGGTQIPGPPVGAASAWTAGWAQ